MNTNIRLLIPAGGGTNKPTNESDPNFMLWEVSSDDIDRAIRRIETAQKVNQEDCFLYRMHYNVADEEISWVRIPKDVILREEFGEGINILLPDYDFDINWITDYKTDYIVADTSGITFEVHDNMLDTLIGETFEWVTIEDLQAWKCLIAGLKGVNKA